MDGEPEKLQDLGAVGIVAESFKILRSFLNSLGPITLTLALPLSFVILAHGPLTQLLFQLFLHVETRSGSHLAEQVYVGLGEVLLIELSYVALMQPFSLLSTSAVAYTVACLYTGKELSYARVISVVPRVWRRVMTTFLWFLAIMVAYYVYVAVLLLVFVWILMKLSGGLFWVLVVVIGSAIFSVYVYISMVWQLASVASVVEDKYGLVAMKKSKDLIKGKCGAALALNIIYLITVGISSQLVEFIVVHGGSYNIGVRQRTANGAILVMWHCAVNLMWLLSQTVFYFVCKSYHHQSIDKSALSDHLEGYLGEYMPLKDSISAVHLEDLDP